jgi:hypothetical protein
MAGSIFGDHILPEVEAALGFPLGRSSFVSSTSNCSDTPPWPRVSGTRRRAALPIMSTERC